MLPFLAGCNSLYLSVCIFLGEGTLLTSILIDDHLASLVHRHCCGIVTMFLMDYSSGESPSSSASDVDNLNNQAIVDKATLSKGTASHVAGNPVIVARNRSNFLRLLDFVSYFNLVEWSIPFFPFTKLFVVVWVKTLQFVLKISFIHICLETVYFNAFAEGYR